MSTAGWGMSTVKNPARAGQQAARSALDLLGSQQWHSCMVFSTVGYDQQVLIDAIRAEAGPVPMVGCSGEGVIGPGIADETNHAVIVLALADPRVRIATAGFPDVSDARAAARRLADQFQGQVGDDVRFVLLLPCGLNIIADDFIDELQQHMGTSIPFMGGTAGENFQRIRTFQYQDWKVYQGGVSAALFSGDFKLATCVSHGCTPIGTERIVTRVEGNRLYEIDGRPILDVMAELVGEDVKWDFGKLATHFCVGQQVDEEMACAYDPFIIRYIEQYHPEDGSISLPVRMNKGDRIHVTRRDHEKMDRGARQSVEQLRQDLHGLEPFLVLHFDCAGRGKVVLSERAKLDLIKSFQDGIGPGIPWAGFFTYGEFAPVQGKNVFHNYSAVIAALY